MAQSHKKWRAASFGATGFAGKSGGASGASADVHTVSAKCFCVRICAGTSIRINLNAAADATCPIVREETFLSVQPGDHINVIQDAAASSYSIVEVDF